MFADIVANEKKERKALINQAREEERALREQEIIETARILLGMGDSVVKVALVTKLAIERVEEIRAGTTTAAD